MDERFPEPLFDELDMKIFVDADHGHDKVTVRSTAGIPYVVGSTPTTSKRQTSVQTDTFGAEFTALKRRLRKQSC